MNLSYYESEFSVQKGYLFISMCNRDKILLMNALWNNLKHEKYLPCLSKRRTILEPNFSIALSELNSLKTYREEHARATEYNTKRYGPSWNISNHMLGEGITYFRLDRISATAIALATNNTPMSFNVPNRELIRAINNRLIELTV